MKITPLDIRRKEFKRSVRGYSDEEVDIFLDEVADEFERLFQENMELHDRMQRLDEQIAGHAQLKDALEKTLISAQLQAEELRANAHKESELILRDAEMKARGIVSDSYGETQKTQQALVQLKLLEEDFRFKFRSLLEGYLRLLSQAPLAAAGGEERTAAVTAPPAAPPQAPAPAPTTVAPAPTAPAMPVSTPVAPAVATSPPLAPQVSPAPPVSQAPPVPSVPESVSTPAPMSPAPPASPPARPQPSPSGDVATAAEAAPTQRAVSAPIAAPAPPAYQPVPQPAPLTPPPAEAVSMLLDDTATEESTFRPSGPSASSGYYFAGEQEATAEVTLETDESEAPLGQRPPAQNGQIDDEPLRRFFFGRQTSDVDDTFQADDTGKKDANREFEW